MAELEELTKPFRAECALAHRGKARLAELFGEHSRADWHFARANGQRERFERVAECGEREVLISCNDCRVEGRRIEARCSQSRLCVRCRGIRAAQYRSSIRAARARTLRETAYLRRPGAPGGEWGERLLTLTIPHSGDIERDVKAINKAWPVFRKKLWAFFRAEHELPKRLIDELRYVRVLEITAGRENDGHAHFHVYLLCPFVPHEFARHAWGSALATQGYATPARPLTQVIAEVESDNRRRQLARVLTTRWGHAIQNVQWPVVDLRLCYGDIEEELFKYLIKDVAMSEGTLQLVDPSLATRIYKALEGVRTIATSRGFRSIEERTCFCEACGSTSVTRRVVKKSAATQVAHAQDSEHA